MSEGVNFAALWSEANANNPRRDLMTMRLICLDARRRQKESVLRLNAQSVLACLRGVAYALREFVAAVNAIWTVGLGGGECGKAGS